MGYFANGSEGTDYELRYCCRCAHRGPDDGPGCAVWEAHMLHNYGANEAREVLDVLIPRNKDLLLNEQCRMFLKEERVVEYQPPLLPW